MQVLRTVAEIRVNGYVDNLCLVRHALFVRPLQALIELALTGSDERAILESLPNYIAVRAAIARPRQAGMFPDVAP